jgi:hypothetical protein
MAELKAQLAELEQKEREALAKDLRESPSKNPFGSVTSAVNRVRKQKAAVERELDNLQNGVLPVLQAEAMVEARAKAEARLNLLRRKIADYRRSVEDQEQEIRIAFSQFLDRVHEEQARSDFSREHLLADGQQALGNFQDLLQKFESEVAGVDPLPNVAGVMRRLLEATGVSAAQSGPERWFRTEDGSLVQG